VIERAEIVAALGTVPGIAASPTTPAVIAAGAAWPVWVSSRWVNSCARDTRWFVFVALSNAAGDVTVEAGDPLIEQVGMALEAIGLGGITVEPWQWATEPGGQTVPVLRVTAVD